MCKGKSVVKHEGKIISNLLINDMEKCQEYMDPERCAGLSGYNMVLTRLDSIFDVQYVLQQGLPKRRQAAHLLCEAQLSKRGSKVPNETSV